MNVWVFLFCILLEGIGPFLLTIGFVKGMSPFVVHIMYDRGTHSFELNVYVVLLHSPNMHPD